MKGVSTDEILYKLRSEGNPSSSRNWSFSSFDSVLVLTSSLLRSHERCTTSPIRETFMEMLEIEICQVVEQWIYTKGSKMAVVR